MQGPEMTPQPIESALGILLFNGDIFDECRDKTVSDTWQIMDKLNKIDLVCLQLLHILVYSTEIAILLLLDR